MEQEIKEADNDVLEANISLRLPDFNLRNPRVWFHQIDALFVTRRIKSEQTKYLYVIQVLPEDVANEVDDLLENIPPSQPYTILREAILTRMGHSKTKMLRELLNNVELGDRTPSQLLRHMRSLLNGRTLEDSILTQLWLDKLPTDMSRLLAGFVEDHKLEQLTKMADKVHETYPSRSVSAVSQLSDAPENSAFLNAINKLNTRIEDLTNQVAELKLRPASRSRSRSRSRTGDGWCWYHAKFRERAKRCRPPCSFVSTSRASSNSRASQ